MSRNDQRNRRILVIDDNEAIHKDFHAILSAPIADNSALDEAKTAIFGHEHETNKINDGWKPFELDSAFQGQEGLEKVRKAIEEDRPYIMAFVDVRMPPGWDGIETIQHIWEECPSLQVVICTAHSDYSWSDMIHKLGQTDRLLVLKKPFDNIEVRQIASALAEKWNLLHDLDEMVKYRTDEIAQTRDVAVFALASLAESRDPETGEHLERIRSYCQIIAEHLQHEGPYCDQIDKQFMEDLYRSSPLHDIGKVGIPDNILLKPGSFTESEFDIMKQHSAIGADALKKAARRSLSGGFLTMATDIARYHHERFNGTGYPEGLKEQDIPLPARIVALADVYDALTSSRVYKPAFLPEMSRSMITEEVGKHFDPAVVEAFQAQFQAFMNVRKLLDSSDAALVKAIAEG